MEQLARRAELAGLNASAPPQQAEVDGWLLRLSPGKAKRSRCVNALAAGSLPLPDLIARCRHAFAAAGLPLIIRVTPYSQPPDLDHQLATMGWFDFDFADVLLRPDLNGVTEWGSLGAVLRHVDASHYARIVGGLRGSSESAIAAHAERMLHAAVEYQGFLLEDGRGELLACGQIVVEGSIVGIYDVFTPPEKRRQGHAETLCRGLLHQAHSQGAVEAYLQVGTENHEAKRLYGRLGFQYGYRYHYRSDDPAAAQA
ncbi:MAG: GNAT family N-acetyltransferase [Paucibacter sp.]|nr:GNAT family N-acetyltransferase [Roseateles sp.]